MKIALIGYGKMGKEIHRLLKQKSDTVIIINQPGELNELSKKSCNVAIEFTTPESAFDNIRYCIEHDIPVVSGTTGWLDKKPDLEAYCLKQNGTFLYASNFSIGVNIFFAINRKLAELTSNFSDYRCGIHEIHHTTKKDAPSGTAITLAEDIISLNNHYNDWRHPESDIERTIKITSDRIKDAPGTHIIKYRSAIDDITISHEAKSREGFARGAILAAEWISDKKGIYTMKDVLGIT